MLATQPTAAVCVPRTMLVTACMRAHPTVTLADIVICIVTTTDISVTTAITTDTDVCTTAVIATVVTSVFTVEATARPRKKESCFSSGILSKLS